MPLEHRACGCRRSSDSQPTSEPAVSHSLLSNCNWWILSVPVRRLDISGTGELFMGSRLFGQACRSMEHYLNAYLATCLAPKLPYPRAKNVSTLPLATQLGPEGGRAKRARETHFRFSLEETRVIQTATYAEAAGTGWLSLHNGPFPARNRPVHRGQHRVCETSVCRTIHDRATRWLAGASLQ